VSLEAEGMDDYLQEMHTHSPYRQDSPAAAAPPPTGTLG
jgi:uncharacterized protein